MFWLLPSPVLKGMVVGGIETQSQDNCISKASNFMADRLNSLDQSVLASRLQINCQPSYVQPHLVNDLPVTIVTVFDESALSEEVLCVELICLNVLDIHSIGTFPGEGRVIQVLSNCEISTLEDGRKLSVPQQE